jgi:hypothetical protein
MHHEGKAGGEPSHWLRNGVGARWSVLLCAAAATACATSSVTPPGGDDGQQTIAICGDDVVDVSEECDGSSMGTGTCSSETNGQRPSGSLSCTSQCAYDSTHCSGPGGQVGGSGGTAGSGGIPNIGLAGTGVVLGAGGIPLPTGGAPGTAGSVGVGGTAMGSGGAMVGGGGAVTTGGTNGAGGVVITTMGEPTIPPAPADCPQLKTGNITVMGQTVQIWAGAKQADKKGAVMFYWHGTGSASGEASQLGPALNEITAAGGVVASFSTSLGTGTNTGNNVWYTDDFKMADVILACAVQQLNIDTHRIYTAGCSAGGLQAGSMVYSRSSYLAASMPNSGGIISFYVSKFENPQHIPSLITAHGGDTDMVVVKFADTSAAACNGVKMAGGIAVDCNHGAGHCQAPADLIAAQWQFLKDHPYGVNPDPYASGLPASFPTYCMKY